MRSIEIFTGAGGLALGLHQAGFRHVALVERDRSSIQTLNANREIFDLPTASQIESADAMTFDWSPYASRMDLVAGGVPCQPFSLGGKHRGHEDERNLFPAMVRAIREVGPAAVLIENVRGLLRPAFAPYYDYVLRQLAMPELSPFHGEQWRDHDSRLLLAAKTYRASGALCYRVQAALLQCANYGVPQLRARVFVVAFRDDLDRVWTPPPALHSQAQLLYEQWVTGSYWVEHSLRPLPMPARFHSLVDKLSNTLVPGEAKRWLTVRDAIHDLAEPHRRRLEDNNEHFANPGARAYPGHVGSPLDWPAKTLKAGVHAVPGGENTLRYINGQVRYFTVREAARLQTFPDYYRFPSSWGESFRQLGNAVPVSIARLIGGQVIAALKARPAQSKSEVAISV